MEYLDEVVIFLKKKFNPPDPRIWKKGDKRRIYYNHPKASDSYVFIDLTDNKNIYISELDKYWKELFNTDTLGLKRIIETMNNKADIHPNEISSNYFFINREPTKLYAYKLASTEDNLWKLGEIVAKKLNELTAGNWIYSNYRLLCDRKINHIKIKNIYETLEFPTLKEIYLMNVYKPRALDTAKWFAHFINKNKFENLKIRSDYLTIDKKSVLSIFILAEENNGKLTLDTTVGDITGKLTGNIVKEIGTLGDERQRLLSLTSRPEMIELINLAPDNEIIYAVKVRNNVYDYISSALYVVKTDINKYLESEKIVKKFEFLGDRISESKCPLLFIRAEDFDSSYTLNFDNIIILEKDKIKIYSVSGKFEKEIYGNINDVFPKISGKIIVIYFGYFSRDRYFIKKYHPNAGLIQILEASPLYRGNNAAKFGDIMNINVNEFIIMKKKTEHIKYYNLNAKEAISCVLRINL